jgi:ankyrin repeat protein
VLQGTGKVIPSDIVQYMISMGAIIKEEAIAKARRTSELLKLLREKNSDTNTIKVKRLIDEGVNLNVRFEDKETPLIKAIANNKNEIALELIKAGADVNLAADLGRTALMKLAGLSDTAKERCIHLKLLNALIAAKADLNAKDQFNNSALFIAINMGHIPIAKELIKAGADVNIPGDWRTGKGRITPLNAVMQHKLYRTDNELIKALMDAGAHK